MQRFKQNDPVFILPKFAQMYPSHSAVVVGVTPDPFRPMFDAYTVKFSNESTAKIFDFQLIDNIPSYETLVATVSFDSRREPHASKIQGTRLSHQIVFQTPVFDLVVKIRADKLRAFITGRVVERATDKLLTHLEVRLMKEGIPISTATSDGVGVFKFSDVSRGSLNILAVLREYHVRILGAFSI